jgi:hypothetical protein
MGKRKGQSEASDPIDRVLGELWATISAGDMLQAELQASEVVSLPFQADSTDEETELVDALVEAAMEQQYGPVAAAFMRLLMSLGPRVVKRAASEALAELTDDGIYPPEWVTGIGKAMPVRAGRAYDVFGDRETVIVTFSYPDEAEHALLVGVNLAGPPTMSVVRVSTDAASLLTAIQDAAHPYERFEEIPLADARRRIEGPLAHAGENPYIDLDFTEVMHVPVARSRVRRLPSGDTGPVTEYTAVDRAAVVDEFLRSSWAAEAGDLAVARFWAEVLAGYSGRVTGEPPGLVGPFRLAAMLLGYAASTFTLTAAQREGLEAAVGAWAHWAAARRDLDQVATDHLLSRLPDIFDEFPVAYDDPIFAARRAYVRDVAASDVDAAGLDEYRARREFAAPLPASRDAHVVSIDATSVEGRAALTEHEFSSCAPEGAEGEQFMATAKRIVEELWHDAPPTTWQAGKSLLDKGLNPHDVIHRLVEARRK